MKDKTEDTAHDVTGENDPFVKKEFSPNKISEEDVRNITTWRKSRETEKSFKTYLTLEENLWQYVGRGSKSLKEVNEISKRSSMKFEFVGLTTIR